MTIDPSTPIGKIRLRIADWNDLPLLPDSVINSALTDCQNSVPRAASLCAQYILAMLASKTHRKMGLLETYGGEHFDHYVEFIKLTILNPHLMSTSPIPYGVSNMIENPLTKFTREWNLNYSGITQSQQLEMDAIGLTTSTGL
jgi:hypothetical protein